MKLQIKHLSLWVILLLLNISFTYADAPPTKPYKIFSKKEIRLQKRLKRREARKLKRRARKVRRAKRFLNSRLGKWFLKKSLKKRKGKSIGPLLILLGVIILLIAATVTGGGFIELGKLLLFVYGIASVAIGIGLSVDHIAKEKKEN